MYIWRPQFFWKFFEENAAEIISCTTSTKQTFVLIRDINIASHLLFAVNISKWRITYLDVCRPLEHIIISVKPLISHADADAKLMLIFGHFHPFLTNGATWCNCYVFTDIDGINSFPYSVLLRSTNLNVSFFWERELEHKTFTPKQTPVNLWGTCSTVILCYSWADQSWADRAAALLLRARAGGHFTPQIRPPQLHRDSK